VLHARLQADSAQVTSLLREHGLDLQYALRKLGLNVDEVTVTVTPDQGEREAAFENFTEQGGSNGNNEDMQEEQLATNGTSNDGAEVPPRSESVDDHWVA
jgi:ABC-type nitrate/sulfonate/bicarbonate transport system substrate-binding protein